jgi:beta-fructofuranosidase
LSVPWLLTRDGDRVVVEPHPEVDSLRSGSAVTAGPGDAVPVGREADVAVCVDPAGGLLEVALDVPGGRLLTLTVAPAAGELRMSGGARLQLRPGADGEVDLRLLLDTGVAEVFSGGQAAAVRLPATDSGLTLGVPGAGAALRYATAHGMERLSG